MPDVRCRHGRCTRTDPIDIVLIATDSAASDHGNGRCGGDGMNVVGVKSFAGPIAVDALQEDFAGAQLFALASPNGGSQTGRRAPAVDENLHFASGITFRVD